jgi:tRNA (adenine57-N1/adenine58-N1)-methyltransferase
MKLLIDSQKKFSTKYGEILLSKKSGPVKTHLGKEFFQLEPKFHDLLSKAKRGPQAVLLKDSAIISAFTGINSSSKVVDAGTGSGWMAAFLAKQINPAKITSYEIKPEFIEVAKKNFEILNIKNIKLKNKDITKSFSEKNIDLLTLDLQEPWKVSLKGIKIGGYAVAYCPQITQAVKFAKYAEKNNFLIEHVFESQLREWKISEKIARPEFQQLNHTAFLVFARRIK